MSSSADFKCMLLVSQDQYEGFKSGPSSRTVDSGIGGDVTDSHVHNIDVSQGGTLVINDGDLPAGGDKSCCPGQTGHLHADRYPTILGRPSDYIYRMQEATPPPPHTQQQQPQLTHQQQQQQQQTTPAATPLATPKSAASKKKSPALNKNSAQLLNSIINKRVSDLTGLPTPPAKRKRVTKSDGDLQRGVIHDLREVAKAEQPRNPTIAQRRVNRYRAQIAKVTPYRVQQQEPKPHEVPLPPSSSEDEDGSDAEDWGPQPRGSGAARTRPAFLARRVPAVIRNAAKAEKRNRSRMTSGPLDPFHYEPRSKIPNTQSKPVRAVGKIAGKKRPISKNDHDKRWEKASFPTKRTIYPNVLPSDDESINSADGE